jgi:hypothetical protein
MIEVVLDSSHRQRITAPGGVVPLRERSQVQLLSIDGAGTNFKQAAREKSYRGNIC